MFRKEKKKNKTTPQKIARLQSKDQVNCMFWRESKRRAQLTGLPNHRPIGTCRHRRKLRTTSKIDKRQSEPTCKRSIKDCIMHGKKVPAYAALAFGKKIVLQLRSKTVLQKMAKQG